MTGTLRTIVVSGEFFRDRPADAAQLLQESMAQGDPADLWMVLIGSRDDATRLLDQLWHYGEPEPRLPGDVIP